MAIKNVFVTGGTGFVGSVVTTELLEHGYNLTGLARSDASAAKLEKKNIKVVRGELTDLDVLRKAAKEADATIHLGFVHDFDNFENSCQIDRKAVLAMVEALEGTNKTFIGTGGLLRPLPPTVAGASNTRFDTWGMSLAYAKKGVRVIQVNLPVSCHGEGDKAFLPILSAIAKEKKMVVYPGDGSNKWSAGNRLDFGTLYLLALEKGEAGKTYYGDAETMTSKEIAAAIAKKHNLPLKSLPQEQMYEAAGFIGMIFSLPSFESEGAHPLGWKPTHATLAEDIERYY